MSLAVLGASRDQIMGNSGHLTRIFFRTAPQTPRTPQPPQTSQTSPNTTRKSKKSNVRYFRISNFLPCFPAKKRKKGALKLPRKCH